MNNLIIKLGFASKWATTNAIGKVATMGLKQPCVATRVLRTKDKRLLWGSQSYWFWCCFGLEEDIRCGANEGPVRAASSPYELALNSSFYGHNYPFREKRFEL
jgi:hypothetical protein